MRPHDPSVLSGRPIVDLGTGDGQTVAALAGPDAIGVDRSLEALRGAVRTGLTRLVAADTSALPFLDGSVRVVLAADVLHHLADVADALTEASRVLGPGGRLVAWWYAVAGRGGPGDPGFPRSFEEVAEAARNAGFSDVEPLDLEIVEGVPATVGMTARA